MADEPTPDATPEPVVPVETPAPVPEPVAPPPDPVAEIRERLARLEGENQALRSQVAAVQSVPRAQPTAPAWTPQTIRAAYDAGQITDDQRVALLADLQTSARLSEYDATRRVQDSQAKAGDALQAYMRAYPALTDPSSPLMRQISAELRQMQAEEGADPQDLRAQLRAVKSLVGPLAPVAGAPTRRSIPIGGTGVPGGGAPSPGGGKPDPLKGIPADIIEDWKRLGAKLDDPAESARYAERYQAMVARRQRRTSGVA